jgi:hypothetical protein
MKNIIGKGRAEIENSMSGLGVGSWTLIVVLLLLLAATGFVIYVGWTLGDAVVPTSGYVAMALGVIFSLLVGFGLMALLFYSSRKGYDQPPVLIAPDNDLEEANNSLETTHKRT